MGKLNTRRVGITPAHAGSSDMIHHVLSPFRDHPRTRGEQYDTLRMT